MVDHLLISNFLRDSLGGKSKLFAVQVRIVFCFVAWVTLEPNFVVAAAATKTLCKWLLRDPVTLQYQALLVQPTLGIFLYTKFFRTGSKKTRNLKTHQPLGDNGYIRTIQYWKRNICIHKYINRYVYIYIYIQFEHTKKTHEYNYVNINISNIRKVFVHSKLQNNYERVWIVVFVPPNLIFYCWPPFRGTGHQRFGRYNLRLVSAFVEWERSSLIFKETNELILLLDHPRELVEFPGVSPISNFLKMMSSWQNPHWDGFFFQIPKPRHKKKGCQIIVHSLAYWFWTGNFHVQRFARIKNTCKSTKFGWFLEATD